ncbi:hypothetical protein AnigIFM60653_002114 [Aspergillus niger]|nr:hypothetical protein AnigIFM50267_002620 [Aspergillus niger]GLA10237.1 hypothetical protein AnigIFM60653_002114 [Aspergillus niger]GLA44599.1 hypothetical protein AnigIFM63309_004220 [Aspergillus niger]
MPKAEPRADIRATTRKSTSHDPVSNPRPIQTQEPITRPPQPPPRSLRRQSTLSQVPGSGFGNTPPGPSLESHETCLNTVEALERENEALRRDKESLSERLRSREFGLEDILG